MGQRGSGALGLGNTTARSTPTQVGAAQTWVSVIANAGSAIATREDGTQWAWGANNIGQLGLGDTTNRSTPTQATSPLIWRRPGLARAV